MDAVTVTGLGISLGLVVSFCSISSFFLGRKKAAKEDGIKQGIVESDVKYLREIVDDIKKNQTDLTTKLDEKEQRRELEYRELVINHISIREECKAISERVYSIEETIKTVIGGNK